MGPALSQRKKPTAVGEQDKEHREETNDADKCRGNRVRQNEAGERINQAHRCFVSLFARLRNGSFGAAQSEMGDE
jgi:hypothetical protein